MKNSFSMVVMAGLLCVGMNWLTESAAAQKGVADLDVQHYKIEAELTPSQQYLRARTEVRFTPVSDTRSVVFELNGSLSVKRIARLDVMPATTAAVPTVPVAPGAPALTRQNQKAVRPTPTPAPKTSVATKAPTPAPTPSALELQFIQDNREKNDVRIDLGSVAPANKPVTLLFEYEGALESAQGGPIANARLAYIGESGSYLLYAARWFPFHEYAADRATYDIKVKVPKGVTVTGYSEQPVVETPVIPDPATIAKADPAKKQDLTPVLLPNGQTIVPTAAPTEWVTYSFVSTKPVLPGNIAAAKYIVRNIKQSGFDIDIYVKVGDDQLADNVAKVIGQHLEYYSSKFGSFPFGSKLIVAQTDDETLETYSGAGIIFLSPRVMTTANEEKLGREVAYQWWGQAVGLRSFDDIWLSQGLAEFSMLMAIKENANETQFQQAVQAELEKALAFEQASSIRNAPKQLDDQTPAYRSVIFYKGALVFNMLRLFMGDKEFDQMLRDYYKKHEGKNVTLDEFEQFVSTTTKRNMRFFFGQWVDSTGVPEFHSDWRVLRTKDGFRVPGTVKQELDTFESPITVLLKTEAGNERQDLYLKGTSVDFDVTTKSKPVDVIVDPDNKIIKSSEELRQGVIVRRGIEHFREQEYTEAEQQFQAAIKLNRGHSWAWYNLGVLYMTQRNYSKALDAFDQGLNGNLRPDWIEVWAYIYRGNAWDALGQRERAVAEYNKAISNGGNYENAQAVAQQYLQTPFDTKKGSTSSASR
jgi:tetratricopeptide (TPR) repeat protein